MARRRRRRRQRTDSAAVMARVVVSEGTSEVSGRQYSSAGFALMMSVALVTLGIFSYKELGVDLMPRTEQPNVNVRVQLPGASAEEVETTLSLPIETAVNSIEGCLLYTSPSPRDS